jgi:hypothetical protein
LQRLEESLRGWRNWLSADIACPKQEWHKHFSWRINMNHLDSMLERNKHIAGRQSSEHTLMPSLPKALPKVKAVIIGCADMRVDPALVLGLKPGEAVVMRNIGGRITPGLLEQLGLLGRIGEVAQEVAGGGGEFHDGPIWKIKQEIVTMMQPATS